MPESPEPSPNQKLLDEVSAAGLWFHAKKTQPLWARLVEADETVETLEGVERVSAGAYLCRGVKGELWPQDAERLELVYEPTDKVDADGWREYLPRPDAEGVMAAQIPHAFTVQAKWGTLEGKAGDYLVKDFADRNLPYPEDVWIVDATIFEATYLGAG